ncbi:putative DD41D transposase [Trichonephila clavipes]|nr:putative DD41D transposase [Trichonephila clavipes]
MDENRTTKKVSNAQSIGTRRKGRPNLRWIDGLENDLLVLRTKNWRTLARGRLEWKRLLEKANANPGCCQVIYSQFGLAIHQNDYQARRRFVEWAQNEIAVVPDFHKRILFSNEAHFWLNGCVNKQNCRIWSEANPQVYVETPFHPEKLTVWCALWAGGILLQKR